MEEEIPLPGCKAFMLATGDVGQNGKFEENATVS